MTPGLIAGISGTIFVFMGSLIMLLIAAIATIVFIVEATDYSRVDENPALSVILLFFFGSIITFIVYVILLLVNRNERIAFQERIKEGVN